jgi:hypothetical protein
MLRLIRNTLVPSGTERTTGARPDGAIRHTKRRPPTPKVNPLDRKAGESVKEHAERVSDSHSFAFIDACIPVYYIGTEGKGPSRGRLTVKK